MKLDGLTANARDHEPALKTSGELLAEIQAAAKRTKKTAEEYSKAEEALRKTLVARKGEKGKQWKVTTWQCQHKQFPPRLDYHGRL